MKVARSITPDDMVCTYVRQPRALGLGHAVLSAKPLVGNDRFAVLLANDLMVGQPPVMQQMVEQFDQWRASILAVQDEPREQTNRYGIVIGQPVADGLVDVSGMAEKPALADAPSTLAVTCQYILTAGIFAELESLPRVAGGEIQLTDGIARLLRREKVFADRYGGQRYECGSKLGIMQATADLGSQHDELGADFNAWLAQWVGVMGRRPSAQLPCRSALRARITRPPDRAQMSLPLTMRT